MRLSDQESPINYEQRERRNAEIMLRILSLKDDGSFLIHPKHFLKHAINYLMRKERKQNIKNDLKSIHELFEE